MITYHILKRALSAIMAVSIVFSVLPVSGYALSNDDGNSPVIENLLLPETVDLTEDTDEPEIDVVFDENNCDTENEEVSDEEPINNDREINCPVVIVDPQDINCQVGEVVYLTVVAEKQTDGKLSYQWFCGDDAIDGAVSDTFCVPTELSGEKNYHCLITNTIDEKEYSINSSIATVCVSGPSEIEEVYTDDVVSIYSAEEFEPTITEQPQSVECKQDEKVRLAVTAEAKENGELSYQWYCNGEAIEGAVNAAYDPSTADVGTKDYYCIVTNTVNGKEYPCQSETATVTVKEKNSFNGYVAGLRVVAGASLSNCKDIPDFEFVPEQMEYNITLTDGAYKVAMTYSEEGVALNKVGNLWYQIYYNGNAYKGNGGSGKIGTKSYLSIISSQMKLGQDNTYAVKVGKKYDSTGDGTISVNDEYESFDIYTFHINKIPGLNTLSVTDVAGNTIAVIPSASLNQVNADVKEFTAQTDAEKVKLKIVPQTSGVKVYVGNSANEHTADTEITLADYVDTTGQVAEIPFKLVYKATESGYTDRENAYTLRIDLVDYTPVIKRQFLSATCGIGEYKELKVEVVAPTDSTLSYQWYEVLDDIPVAIAEEKSAIMILPTEQVGTKTYTCAITNTVGGKTYTAWCKNKTYSIVSWETEPPRILMQPTDIVCGKNDKVYLRLTADENVSKGAVYYYWYEVGTDVGNSAGSSYAPNTSEIGTKQYYCLLTWRYDGENHYFKSDTASVTVREDYDGTNYTPIIVEQPKTVSCNKGETVTVSIKVAELETGKLTYQWYWRGVKVESATSDTFTIPTQNAGSYSCYCIVTNEVGGQQYTVQSDMVWETIILSSVNTPVVVKDFGSYYKDNKRLDVITDYQTLYETGEIPKSIFLQFSQSDSGDKINGNVAFRLETYHNTRASMDGAELVNGATSSENSMSSGQGTFTYEYYVDLNKDFDVGDHYFFCVVTAYNDVNASVPSATLTMGPVKITYKEADIQFDGNGSSSTPYQLL